MLEFTLLPDAITRLHDVLICLSKFSDMLCLEARPEYLEFTALNDTKSTHASCSFSRDAFFETYHVDRVTPRSTGGSQVDSEAAFTCQLYNRALLAVFKAQLKDLRGDTAIERCSCRVQEESGQKECRFIIKMMCRHGVIKTYKLTYEEVEVMHALFDESTARNKWSLKASTLRSFSDHFGYGTEQLDLGSENGRMIFTSYTEKVMSGNDILKHPMQTTVSLDTLDFPQFSVEEQLHIGIHVKDFKTIVAHAETLKADIACCYSVPVRPMRLSYTEHGISCVFTLMTIGDYRTAAAAAQPAPTAASTSAAVRSRPTSIAPRSAETIERAGKGPSDSRETSQPRQKSTRLERTGDMPPPAKIQRASPPRPRASVDSESLSLFLPQFEDEDRRWGTRAFEDEDTIGWSASAVTHNRGRNDSNSLAESREFPTTADTDFDMVDQLLPTQHVSQVKDIFGD